MNNTDLRGLHPDSDITTGSIVSASDKIGSVTLSNNLVVCPRGCILEIHDWVLTYSWWGANGWLGFADSAGIYPPTRYFPLRWLEWHNQPTQPKVWLFPNPSLLYHVGNENPQTTLKFLVDTTTIRKVFWIQISSWSKEETPTEDRYEVTQKNNGDTISLSFVVPQMWPSKYRNSVLSWHWLPNDVDKCGGLTSEPS